MEPQLEIAKAALESASDLAKQLITLSIGILGFTVTFTKDIVKDVSRRAWWLLKASWLLYLVSIIAGISALSALTGTLAPLNEPTPSTAEELKIESNVRVPAGIQEISFIIASVALVLYGSRAGGSATSPTSSGTASSVNQQVKHRPTKGLKRTPGGAA